jgi:DNA processing protein
MGRLLVGRFGSRVNGSPAAERLRLWRLIWGECPGIGWQRLLQLERLGPQEQGLSLAWELPTAELAQQLAGIGGTALEKIDAYRQSLGPRPLATPLGAEDRQRWRRSGCLLATDRALPDSIRELEKPPLRLYWHGRGSLWANLRRRKAIAVVGTRRPSRHGDTMAHSIGRALAAAGWPVVSGLAEGIDAAAHRGCLEAGGRPVGILGTPLERVYPRHHGVLQRQVGEQGLLVSELAPGTAVQPGHFAQRNRLQVALARAVVLVECPEGSGALQSMRQAFDQGMPTWVVPGDAAKVSARGSNGWLGKAKLLVDPAALIQELGPGPLARPLGPDRGQVQQGEAALLGALGQGASLEQLCDRLRMSPAALAPRLVQLELAGIVRPEPGLWWRPR